MSDTIDKPEVEIAIDTSTDFETITLTFVTDEKNITIGFSLQEAQMLNSYLNEAVGSVMSHKLGLLSVGTGTKH